MAGTSIASAWLMLVAVNLAVGGSLDVAVRDVVLSIAAYGTARLLQAQGALLASEPVTVDTHVIA